MRCTACATPTCPTGSWRSTCSDRNASTFWDTPRRDALVSTLGIARVPQVAAGHFTLSSVPLLLGPSQLVDGPAEGVYLTWSAGGDTTGRAKVVRQSFVQGIDEHWAGRPLEVNGLASGAVW